MVLRPTEEDSSFPNLVALAEKQPWTVPPTGVPKVLFISLYCYKSFPVRTFHALTRTYGFDSHAVFFKTNRTNHHAPITDREITLLQEVVGRVQPDLVAISVLAPYMPAARRVVAAVRSVCPAPVVAGGKHPTIAPDEVLGFADYACKGEGELVLLDLFDRMAAGRDFKGITGLWHCDAEGNPVDMGQRRLIQNLDAVPFEDYGAPQMYFIEDDSLATDDPELEEEEILMMAGRGCVYTCSYCVNSLLIPLNRGNGRFVRIRSPENVVAQVKLRMGQQPKARVVSFNDEVFGVFDDWTADFAERYRAAGGLPFNAELVPKLIKAHNIELLRGAGLYEMHFGIQSGSDEIRNTVLDRPGKNHELIEKAWMLAGKGVRVQCDLILDNPFDTAAVLRETIELLERMPRPLQLNTYKMQYFPRYPFTQRALAAGFIGAGDVAEETAANRTLYGWIFEPKLALDHRTVLENCVYLLHWNNWLVWALATRLARGPNLILGALASLLAKWRYRLDFCADPWAVWLRRGWVLARMLVKGDVTPLLARMRTARLRGG